MCALYKHFVKIGCSVAFLFFGHADAQDFNDNSALSYINHNIPKSPEASSLAKYGAIPVNESTGIPDISVPLYNLKGASLNVPITLAYHASGIKVNQEATWAGLGWDIITGGRITLEIRGGYDRYTKQYLNSDMKHSIDYFVMALPPPPTTSVIGINAPVTCRPHVGDPTFPPPCVLPDSIYESSYETDIPNISKYGLAEPDLFHADFMGYSFTFYKDLFTDSIRFKGEHNLFSIEEVENSAYSNSFKIIDNQGIAFYFEQEENSDYRPYLEGLIPAIPTSWLLTKIVHPNGDYMLFHYANFGTIYAAPAISESLSYDSTYHFNTNVLGSAESQVIYQEPEYLTSIESKNTTVRFILSQRKDIGGDGARKLDKITVESKASNSLISQVKFNYDYFNGSGGLIYFDTTKLIYGTPGPDNTVLNHLSLRLKLLSVDVYGIDSLRAETHRFFYNGQQLPNKFSLSQDHWGYYNGRNLNAANFTPSTNSLVDEGVLGRYVYVRFGLEYNAPANFDLIQHFPGYCDKRADEQYAMAGILDSIVYPTGGSTKFNYELNRSFYGPNAPNLIGGGTRVKSIVTYAAGGSPPSRIEYKYENSVGTTSGVYMGTLDYVQVQAQTYTSAQWVNYENYIPLITVFSNGNLIEEGPFVQYTRVIKKIDGGANGWIETNFHVRDPQPPQVTGDFDVIPQCMYLAPTPERDLDGVKMNELYYDGSNVLKKRIDFYYTQRNVRDTFYGLKLIVRGFSLDDPPVAGQVIAVYDPVRSFHILLDSTLETSYEPSGAIATKKAFTYNSYFQPEYTSTSNSKGGQDIIYTKTPLSYTDVPQGEAQMQGNAQAISYMRFQHIYENPIEKVMIKRSLTGDSIVTGGTYYNYDVIGNIREIYLLESSMPISKSSFQLSHYSGPGGGYTLAKDTRYGLSQTINYWGLDLSAYGPPYTEGGPYIKEVKDRSIVRSFLVDTFSNNVLAMCLGAPQSDIAYTSFESAEKGSWSYTGPVNSDVSSPTGTHCYDLGNGTLTRTGLESSKTYNLTYWTKNGSFFPVTGTIAGSAKQGLTKRGWTFFSQKIAGVQTAELSGTGLIDEVRIYPATAEMQTYTYDSIFRMTAQTDIASKITYYEYDPSNRLCRVRDMDKNILKKFDYRYAEQKLNFDGIYYNNNMQHKTFVRNNCTAGSVPASVDYVVPEGKYKSTISQDTVDKQAADDIVANGQNYANSHGACTFYNHFISASFTRNNCNPGYTGSTITYSVPEGTYSSLIDQNDVDQKAQADLNANGQSYANAHGSCRIFIALSCSSGVPEPFSLELYNSDTFEYYYFDITSTGAIGEIPPGTYSVRINPVSYSHAYTYEINGTYYTSEEISPVFDNISFLDNSTIDVYDLP